MKRALKYFPILLAALLLSGFQLQAQNQKEEQKLEKEKQALQEQMKKEQLEQKKELERVLKESKVMKEEEMKALMENQKEFQEQALRQYKDNMAIIRKEHDPSWSFVIPDTRFEAWDSEALGLRGYFGDARESTSLNIHKDVSDLTFSTKFKYEVQEGSKSFRFSASGSVEKGTILIKLINPDDKVIHEFEVSPLADVEWSQGFRWTEEEADENFGTWTIVVSAQAATGSYQVSVRAN